jgi:hypothetical protein
MQDLEELKNYELCDWEILAPFQWEEVPYLRISKALRNPGTRKVSSKYLGKDRVLVAVARDSIGKATHLAFYKPGYDFERAYADYRQNLTHSPTEAIDSRLVLGTATADEIWAELQAQQNRG